MNFTPLDLDLLERLNAETFIITGAEGMLGRAFSKQIRTLLPCANLYSLDRVNFDVENPKSLERYLKHKPTIIIHCAALVDADYCEKFPDAAHNSIVAGTQNILTFAEKCSAKIFYPQSFLIFDQPNQIIDEETLPNASHVYGKMKIEAEKIILEHSPFNLSVRMGGFFGGDDKDNNFVGMISRHFLQLLKNNIYQISIGDRIWQPSYTQDLAANSLLLLAHGQSGIFNLASHGSCSFFELAQEITKILSIDEIISIAKVSAESVAKTEPAKRPKSAIMKNSRALKVGLDRQRDWRIALADYLSQPYFKDLFRDYNPTSRASCRI